MPILTKLTASAIPDKSVLGMGGFLSRSSLGQLTIKAADSEKNAYRSEVLGPKSSLGLAKQDFLRDWSNAGGNEATLHQRVQVISSTFKC